MRPRLPVLLILVGMVAGACGGSGYAPTTGGASGNGGGNATPPPPAAATTIEIVGVRGGQSFAPNPASVRQGEMLLWRNTDAVVHHIVLNDGSLDAGEIAPGASSAALRLGTDGANYHCTIHPTMVGSINKASGEPPPCTGDYCPHS